MKKLMALSLMAVLFVPLIGQAVIVNNSGTDGADSISFPFYALDSAGNMVNLTTNDSIWIHVYYPDNGLAWRDSLAYNGTGVTSTTGSGFTTYTLAKAVADIDGTATDGVYSWLLIVDDNTGAALNTPHTGHFQLFTAGDYEDMIDSATMAADNNAEVLNIDAWNPITDNDSLITDRSTSSVNVASVDNNALNLGTDVTGVLADGNVATIGVNLVSTSSGAITSTSLATSCIGGDELAPTAVDEIWDEDTTGHNTAGSYGQIIEDLLDSINVLETWVAQQAGTGLTDAAMGRIADTVWQNDSASMYAGGVGTVGDVVRDSAFGAGALSTADIGRIADTVWQNDSASA
ncbi:MAG: hypothetical protein ACYS21_07095, partial [Planctomycetota bacterium]